MKRPFYIKHWSRIILVIQIIAIIFIFIALLLNPFVVAKLLNKEQDFLNITKSFIYTLEAILFSTGMIILLLQEFYLKRCSEKAKDITISIILLILSLMIVLLLSELLVRIVAPQKTLNQLKSLSPQIYEEGDHISWEYKPNSTGIRMTGESNATYRINSFGMRDKERAYAKKPQTKRVLMLGDSVTAGFGVLQNETFSCILEDSLNNRSRNSSISYEVWNAGVEGYSADSEYVFLKNNIKNISPDMVVLIFYAGNDILDLSKNSWEKDNIGLPVKVKSNIIYVQDNQLRLKESPLNPYKITFFGYIEILLFRWSHLYILLRNAIPNISSHGDFEGVSLMIREAPQEVTQDLEKTEILISAMKDLASQNNASFAMVIFPARMQINDREWNIVERKFKNYEPERNLVQQEMMGWCNSKNMACIDLFDYFISSKKQLYFTLTDMHPNREGHKLAASVIEKKLFTN